MAKPTSGSPGKKKWRKWPLKRGDKPGKLSSPLECGCLAQEKRRTDLTNPQPWLIISNMKRASTMTDLLRQALAEAESVRAVCRATGLQPSALTRFMQGTSLRLDLADRLAAHFGIECRRKAKSKGKE